MRFSPSIACLFGLGVLLGCSEGSSPSSSVTYARVIGVVVAVEGDETRATPRADEAARAQVLVAGPDGAVAVHYALSLCVAGPNNAMLPSCAGEVLATSVSDTPSNTPTLSWSALDVTAVSDARELLILGTVCEQGVVATDSQRPGDCVDPTFRGVSFFSHVTLLDADETQLNHHPSLDAAVVTFDGATWNDNECVTVARDGAEHALSITLHDSRRETFEGTPEAPLVSWFTTAGALGQHYSVLESHMPESTPLDVTWKAPPPTNDKQRAHVTLVLRDQRGGIDWTTREVCFE